MWDVVVVGQGLAGTCLGLELELRGLRVGVVDAGSGTLSSRVAAGLVNPVVPRGLRVGWRAAEFLEAMLPFYQRASEEFNCPVWEPLPMWKPLLNASELEEWQQARTRNPFLGEVQPAPAAWVHAPFGCGVILNSGWVRMGNLLDAYRLRLKQEERLREETLTPEDVRSHDDLLHIGSWTTRKIVLCQGAQSFSRWFFPHAPEAPVKGEVLEVELPEALEVSLNKGVFLLPVSNKIFRLGATYSWDPLNTEPTEAAQNELMQKAAAYLKTTPQIVAHRAGIRPATQDRKPLLGESDEQPGVFILNGLGSKGALMAPWLAAHLADVMLNQAKLEPEVNVHRRA